MKRKEYERESKNIVGRVYKRDKEKEGKHFSLHFEGKMVFHHCESNFNSKENDFTILLQTKQCEIKNRAKQFFKKIFYPYPRELRWQSDTNF